MSVKKDSGSIDWNELDRCWAKRYEQEYGHYFSDLSNIDIPNQLHILSGVEASAGTYI